MKSYLRTFIRKRPALYFAFALISPKIARNRARRNSDLILEGFPRSANSYSLNFFRNCQSDTYRIAHHLHAPAQVVYGCQHGIPCMVLIRNPEDAFCSLKVMSPDVSFAEMIADYCSFYEVAWQYREKIYFAIFEDVVNDFNPSILAFNDRFGTTFQSANDTEEKVAETFETLQEYNKTEKKGNQWELPIPTEEKNQKKQAIRDDLLNNHREGLENCRRIYERIINYIGERDESR